MDWSPLREEISATTVKVADLLRSVPGPTPLTRVRWSAAELGAHLVSLPGRYRLMAASPHPLPRSPSDGNDRAVGARCRA